jgi:hypothetical protein
MELNKNILENGINEISSSFHYYGRKGKIFFRKNPVITVASAFLLGVSAAFIVYSSVGSSQQE